MKIDDGHLKRYLVKHLQPLTEADPALLANYIEALLKNNKPKKELQKLCIDQLYDFLGDRTKGFVVELFRALEEGRITTDELENSRLADPASLSRNADAVDARTSPPHVEKHSGSAVRIVNNDAEESTDDEDDDRNHKHRRRVSRSRSFDRDGDDVDTRELYAKRSRLIENGQLHERQVLEHRTAAMAHLNAERDSGYKFDRRPGRDHLLGVHSRINLDGIQRGIRGGLQFRGDPTSQRFYPSSIRGAIGRGRGNWLTHERFPAYPDIPEFPPPLLSQASSNPNFFAGRGITGRGGAPQSPWVAYSPITAIGNGSLDHPHPLNTGIQGGRANPMNPAIGMNMGLLMGRPRCLDFEERGYCLRGDLCPMEHGANRIVVEDVQSLSKLNLPVSLAMSRSVAMGSGPVSASSAAAPSHIELASRTHRGTREVVNEEVGQPNAGTTGNDSYDPDQPLLIKDHSEEAARKMQTYQAERPEQDWAAENQLKAESEDKLGRGPKSASLRGMEAGVSVWDRIGPMERKMEGGSRLAGSTSEGVHVRKQLKNISLEEVARNKMASLQDNLAKDTDLLQGSSVRLDVSSQNGHGELRASQHRPENNVRSTGHINVGFTGERAQRTLYVRCIPTESNKTELLLAHFQKFGEVLDVRIPPHSDRAFVQFARREDAETALISPDAVMGNRFIRLSWANRDNISDPWTSASRLTTSTGAISLTQNPNTQTGKDTAATPASYAVAVSMSASAKSGPSNGLVTSAAFPAPHKKQEELEQMREEIRKKQEALAQKRDEFRRKLEKLSKQGNAVKESSEGEQEVFEGAPVSQGSALVLGGADILSAKPNVEGFKANSVVQTSALSQPSPKISKSTYPRASTSTSGNSYNSVPWPATRYKLDNRTTVLKIIPPLPSSASDVGVLKDHFSQFGDITSVELEDAEGHIVEGSSIIRIPEGSGIRFTFATRRDAERAFSQGKCLQGHPLQLSWVIAIPAGGKNVDTSSLATIEKVPCDGGLMAEKGCQELCPEGSASKANDGFLAVSEGASNVLIESEKLTLQACSSPNDGDVNFTHEHMSPGSVRYSLSSGPIIAQVAPLVAEA